MYCSTLSVSLYVRPLRTCLQLSKSKLNLNSVYARSGSATSRAAYHIGRRDWIIYLNSVTLSVWFVSSAANKFNLHFLAVPGYQRSIYSRQTLCDQLDVLALSWIIHWTRTLSPTVSVALWRCFFCFRRTSAFNAVVLPQCNIQIYNLDILTYLRTYVLACIITYLLVVLFLLHVQASTFLLFVLPVLVISCLYVFIALKLRSSTRFPVFGSMRSSASSNERRRQSLNPTAAVTRHSTGATTARKPIVKMLGTWTRLARRVVFCILSLCSLFLLCLLYCY